MSRKWGFSFTRYVLVDGFNLEGWKGNLKRLEGVFHFNMVRGKAEGVTFHHGKPKATSKKRVSGKKGNVGL